MTLPTRTTGSPGRLPTTADGLPGGIRLLLANLARERPIAIPVGTLVRVVLSASSLFICLVQGNTWAVLSCPFLLYLTAFPRVSLWRAVATVAIVTWWLPVLGILLGARLGVTLLVIATRRGKRHGSLRERGHEHSLLWRSTISAWAVGPAALPALAGSSGSGARPDMDELAEAAIRYVVNAWCTRERFGVLRGLRAVFDAVILGETEALENGDAASLESAFEGMAVQDTLIEMSVGLAVAVTFVVQLFSEAAWPWQGGVFRMCAAFAILYATVHFLTSGKQFRRIVAVPLVVEAALLDIVTAWAAGAAIAVSMGLLYAQWSLNRNRSLTGLPSWIDARWAFQDLRLVSTLRARALSAPGTYSPYSATALANAKGVRDAQSAVGTWSSQRLAVWGEIVETRVCLASGNLALGDWHSQHALRLAETVDARLRAEALLQRGLVLAEVGSLNDACDQVEAAADLFSGRRTWRHRKVLAQSELVRLYGLAGRTNEVMPAARECRLGLSRARAFNEVVRNEVYVAEALLAQGDVLGARAAAEAVSEFHTLFSEDEPNGGRLARPFAEAILLLGHCYRIENRLREARVAYLKAAEAAESVLDPQVGARCQVWLQWTKQKTGEPGDHASAVAQAVRILETARLELRGGDQRAVAVEARAEVFAAALEVMEESNAPFEALTILESLYRDGVAAALTQGMKGLPHDSRVALEELYSDSGRRMELDAPADRDQLRAKVAEGVSDVFAELATSTEFDPSLISNKLVRRHLLLFHVLRHSDVEMEGIVIWISPESESSISRFRVASSGGWNDSFQVVSDLAVGNSTLAHLRLQRDTWASLGEELIPERLRLAIRARTETDPLDLVVVPGQVLDSFPFACLRVEGDWLLARCRLRTLPSVAFLEAESKAPSSTASATVMIDGVNLSQTQVETAAWALASGPDFRVDYVDSRSQFEYALSRPDASDLVYVSAHGGGSSHGHRFGFPDGGVYSAADAMQADWPSWVVFGACWSGAIQIRPGKDMFGLPTACLLRGAQSVIGGILDIQDEAAGIVLAGWVERVAAGIDPLEALRLSQLGYARTEDTCELAPAATWGALVAMCKT